MLKSSYVFLTSAVLWSLMGCSAEEMASIAQPPPPPPPPAPVVPATVSRTVTATPAQCPAGGAANESGPDRNGNGALDDDEVETTSLACGDLVAGDVVVMSDAEVAQLAGIHAILGNLTISGSVTDARLPALQAIGGTLKITGMQVGQIALPKLDSVGGDLVVYNSASLASLSLRIPTHIHDLTIERCTALASLDLTQDREASIGALAVLDNPALTHAAITTDVAAGIYFGGNAQLGDVALTLSTIAYDVAVDTGNALLQDTAPFTVALASRGRAINIGGELEFGGKLTQLRSTVPINVQGRFELSHVLLTTLDETSRIETVGSLFLEFNNQLVSVDALHVRDQIDVISNLALRDFHVTTEPQMSRVNVIRNADLTALDFAELRAVTSFTARTDPALASLSLPVLGSADSFSLSNDPVLPTCQAQKIIAKAAIAMHFVQGTDDTAVCAN